MRRWSPPQSYIRDVLEAFQQDYFLCQPGSPFLEVSKEYEKKCPPFQGWDYGLIKIGAFCDKKRWNDHQQKVWTNQKHWESSFWAFLVGQLYQVAMKGREMGWVVEPVEIVWFPIDVPKSFGNSPEPFHPLVWNTGSCHRMPGHPCRIFVVRWQEAWKVLLHEALHWLKLGNVLEHPKLSALWKKEKNWTSRGPLLLEEAWVEALASEWFPRFYLAYAGVKNAGSQWKKYERLRTRQFQELYEACRLIWARDSPNNGSAQCALTETPFDSDACRDWHQDTNVFSYVFWKNQLMKNPVILDFLRLPLEEQMRQLGTNQEVRYGLQLAAYRCLEEPYQGVSVGVNKKGKNRVIRFLPELNRWVPKEAIAHEDDVRLG